MGSTFKLSSLDKDKLNELLTPIVFCADKDKIAPYIEGYKVLSINGIVSKRLLELEQDKRNLFVGDVLSNIIDKAGEPLLIKDFEILFDPEYQLDILKLFIMANRKKRIAIIWCGKCRGGKLIFAEPEYPDYKSYNIKDYDISCLI